MKNLVSIIIPCFNDAQYIEQAVDSAINQTYENIEVIVIDDGSNAETKSVLKKLEYKVTKLITQENQGQSAARNRGIEIAKGDFILVLDSDDYFETTFCEKAIFLFKTNDSIKIVTSHVNILINEMKSSVYIPAGGLVEDFLLSNGATGSCMFKRNDWQESGGYDEVMRKGFEDWEFYIRLLKSGGQANVIQEVLFNYRKRQDSTTSKANLIRYELLEYIYLKHQCIYLENYEKLIQHLLFLVKREQLDKDKKINSLEYVIGYNALKPLRFLKSLFS